MKYFLTCLFVLFRLTCFATYYSQCNQDGYVNETYFKNYRNGTFIDIGAHNGITYSNSYFFEKELGWQGICIEPIPEVFAQLRANRTCHCVQGCVSDRSGEEQLLRVISPCTSTEMLSGLLYKYDPLHLQRILAEIRCFGGTYEIIPVQCYLLNDLLEEHGITHVNFLSIDVEGGEYDILTSIDFSRCQIDIITVENNYGDPRFTPLLKEKGFNLIGHLEQDLLFVHKDFQLPEQL